MELDLGLTLLILGLFLLTGYLAHVGGRFIHVPKVSLILVVGALVGPAGLDAIPEQVTDWFPLVAHMALGMVGFLLGENFVISEIRARGRESILMSIGESVLTAGVVALVMIGTMPFTGISTPFALLLGGIACASAPAAIFETVHDTESSGPLTESTLRIVALDDAWGVLTFSVFFLVAQIIAGVNGDSTNQLVRGAWEVAGAVLVGGAVGLPMAWVTPRVRGGETTLVEAMGFVFVAVGLASALDVSYLLTAMVTGAVVANLAHGSRRPFSAVEGVREPFMAIFFVLSGFEFQLGTIATVGWSVLLYVGARALGKVGGAYLTGRVVGAAPVVRRRVGLSLMPQAGVALGFALLAQQELPEIGEQLINVVIASTVLFEITGPILLRRQLAAAGEIPHARG